MAIVWGNWHGHWGAGDEVSDPVSVIEVVVVEGEVTTSTKFLAAKTSI